MSNPLSWKSRQRTNGGVLALVAFLVLAATTLSGQTPPDSAAGRKSAASSAPSDAAKEAVADRAPALPGDTVPSPLEGTDLGKMLKRDFARLEIKELASGTRMIDLAGGFRSVLVMQIDPEGKPLLSCIVSETEGEKLLKPPPPLTKVDDGGNP